MRPRHRPGHKKRAQHCADLIQGRVQSETPAAADGMRGFRKQHVTRGRSQALPGALGDHQQRRDLPASGEGKHRHGRQVHCVANDRDGPICARAVREKARSQAQGESAKLAEAHDEPDLCGGGSQVFKERAGDAACALVGCVGEQAHDAEADDEPDG